jgi:hypothetical protein
MEYLQYIEYHFMMKTITISDYHRAVVQNNLHTTQNKVSTLVTANKLLWDN